ncbi:MAG: penicillin-binding protein 1C [Thermodesulfobacteriota bacterium]
MGDGHKIREVALRLLTRRRQVVIAAAAIAGIAFWRCLPEPLFDEPSSSVLVSRSGELLGAKIAGDGQWRFSGLERVPGKFKTAIVQFEDKRFFHHPGVDPLALVRSLYLNLSEGRVVSGGSTLSMQAVRLSRKNPERSYTEKLVEMVLALRLELRYDKDEVLALYANHAPFGGNVVGLEAAAWRYFGRSPEELSWAEASTLAVLPNSPSLIHPGRNREQLKEKRDRLLGVLHKRGVIDGMQLKLARLEPLPGKPVPLPRIAPHLLETLLANNNGLAYRFESTVDKPLQLALSGIVQSHSRSLDLRGIGNAAALVLDNRNFEVLAYVGNSALSTDPASGHAVDIIRRPRSTGSILKPLLFAAMIDAGEILPKTLVPDLPTQYAGYMPENYDRTYRGAVPAQEALARSLNVPAIRMLKRHGVNRFYDYLEQMGMSTLHRRPADYGLTLILGGAEGTLWDLVGIYANMANIAKRATVTSRTTYSNPKLLWTESIESDRVVELTPAGAWLTLNALQEVTRPYEETHWKNFSSSRKIAWKTGTSYGLRDGWAIGSTSRHTVGVWVGNASGEGRPDLTGLSSAAPLLFDIFNRLEPSPWFSPPYASLKEVLVCKDDGYLAGGGCETEVQLAPIDSHFERMSPYHRLVHMDKDATWRVHGICESVSDMEHRSWFVLPPGQEFYYRRQHPEYRTLPPYRKDCQEFVAASGKRAPIGFLYPNVGTRLYIPTDLAEKKGKTVFEAVHRDRGATLYWHLDDLYLGSTRTFHQMAFDIRPGIHRITVVDKEGNRLSRKFEVLGKEQAVN